MDNHPTEIIIPAHELPVLGRSQSPAPRAVLLPLEAVQNLRWRDWLPVPEAQGRVLSELQTESQEES